MPVKRIAIAVIIAIVFGWFAWAIVDRVRSRSKLPAQQETGPAPVQVAPVERGAIELRRTLSGTLESPGRFVVAPKVAGRVEHLAVDIADPVRRGQVVAELDDAEYVQEAAQADAEVAVARANLAEAVSGLEIAERQLKRVETLTDQQIGSDAELDAARAEQLAKQAAVKVAEAQVTRAEAGLSAARIRLGYTKVEATWKGGDDHRVVAERHVEEGDTVAANTQLLTIVELDPITAVIYLPGRDYGRIQPGQPVTLTTDSYPNQTFSGTVTRVAPIFQEASRQARAELTVDNPEHQLKPGMFVRAEAVLGRAENATIVPLSAVTRRANETGVFVVNPEGTSVSWRPVEVAITEKERVQVVGEGISGRVVTLGQQLLDDGSSITIPEEEQTLPMRGPSG